MSVAELDGNAPGNETQRSLSGWGRVAPSRASVVRPRDAAEIAAVLARAQRAGTGVIARGAGRSYGDAAQSGGGTVIDMTGWQEIVSIDESGGCVTAQAGTNVGQLLAALQARGLTLPVVPGTCHVTLGGAIASDVHGKNHHRDGGLARHVLALSLCTPARGCIELSPAADPELFYATLGGMGLTGVVVEATLATEPLRSPWLAVDVDRTDGLEQTLALMSAPDRHRYSVAWLDLLASGARLGRAVVARADEEPTAQIASRARPVTRPRRPPGGPSLRARTVAVPRGFPGFPLRPAALRALNGLRWHASPRRARGRRVALWRYLFPLDRLGEWHRLYGRTGLIQYQFVVPVGQEATLVRCVELMRARRLPVYLAVFKRLGPAFGGPLSFPLDGWTLAVDMPARLERFGEALEELDELVAGCGGRVYLTKDARLRREPLAAMYPELDYFQSVCAKVDPQGVLGSDLSRRLGLGRRSE
jgi:decaprenylphospho-beta-D-ribofuranose 2-oxidase